MKTKLVFMSLLALVVLLTSCNKTPIAIIPSGNVTTQEKSISGSSKLRVSHSFNVYVTFSDSEESLIVEASENLHQYIEIEEGNDQLNIDLRNNVNILPGRRVLDVYIKTKNINEFLVEGASNVILENELNTHSIDIELNGASVLRGRMNTQNMIAVLEGASELNINGEAELFDITANGASTMKNYDFFTNRLYADLNGGSRVYTSVYESIKVKANGASTLYYKGSGVVKSQDLNGGSRVLKKD